MQGTVTLNDIVEEKWLWTSSHEKMVTQGPRMNMYNGSEHQINERQWNWMLNRTTVLNAKTKKDDDSQCMNGYEKKKTALNSKLKEKYGKGGKRQT